MKFAVEELSVWYGRTPIVDCVSADFSACSISALIGASGCGKTTLLRALNRTAELTAGFRHCGRVLLDGEEIYDKANAETVRRRIGLVAQKPIALPFNIRDNILFAPQYYRGCGRQESEALVENSLKEVGLWSEVCFALTRPAASLSGGQLQRLSIARVLALEPEVLLLDEPCSSLDPLAARQIEELLAKLATRLTIVLVTHNLQQAQRIATQTIFMNAGRIVEAAATERLFNEPQQDMTRTFLRQ